MKHGQVSDRCSQLNEEPQEQDNSLGILLILEVEGVKVQIGKLSVFITEAIEKGGAGLISYKTHKSGIHADSIIFILKKDYVIVRTLTKYDHFAFDINLWNSFEKMEIIKTTIISCFGRKRVKIYSYRIIDGRFFDMST